MKQLRALGDELDMPIAVHAPRSRIGIDNLRIYFSGNNLLTATEFRWIDPESANVPTGYYPQQRTFTFGVDLSF